jgi:hypothetical protein
LGGPGDFDGLDPTPIFEDAHGVTHVFHGPQAGPSFLGNEPVGKRVREGPSDSLGEVEGRSEALRRAPQGRPWVARGVTLAIFPDGLQLGFRKVRRKG